MKIAAYCRVSTDSRDQANSFESQQRYFREYIERNPDWSLYDVYADEGISGTSTKKRSAFNRMIADAQSGKFELIITKEVSRFARNTVDTLQFTRELKRWGVGVLFMNDGINTLDPDAELRLSIMGSIAQEESRKTSSRVKWGQARRMEQGVVFGRSLLGYHVKDGHISIEPDGAEIVKLIFHKCVDERKGTTVIARELKEAGYKTSTDRTDWNGVVVLRILKNEKYCGDLLQKKTITPDYLTHQKKYNRGEEEMIYIKDHHEAIIDRDTWLKAQEELKRRSMKSGSGGHGNRYPLSGKIKCGSCGKSFSSRLRVKKDGTKYGTWRCDTTCKQGKEHTDSQGNVLGCNTSYQIRNDIAIDMIRQSLSTVLTDTEAIVDKVTNIVTNVLQNDNKKTPEQAPRPSGALSEQSAKTLHKKLSEIRSKKKSVLDAYFTGTITKEDMNMMNNEYDSQMRALSERLNKSDFCASRQTEQNISSRFLSLSRLEKDIHEKLAAIANYDNAPDSFYGKLVKQITAYPDKTMEVALELLPTRWKYRLSASDTLLPSSDCGCSKNTKKARHSAASLPMSVSVAIPSLKGIE
ncbi:recombinase family protein [bacterium 210820-DFI.6.37]|nr:recombinase family protein [bacterium 210820-DFI.6.37]